MGVGCGKSNQRNVYNPQIILVTNKQQVNNLNIKSSLPKPNDFFKPVILDNPNNYNKRVKCIKINKESIPNTLKLSNDNCEADRTFSQIESRDEETIMKRKSTTNLEDIQLFSFRMSPKYSDQEFESANKENEKPCERSNTNSDESILTKRQLILNESSKTIIKEVIHRNVLKEVTLVTPTTKGTS